MTKSEKALAFLERAVRNRALPIPLRVIIVGGPRTGKTTLAKRIGEECVVRVRNTDDLIGKFDWSAASLEASTWIDDPSEWILEGVTAVRALRKWLANHPREPLHDLLVIYLEEPAVPQAPGHVSMSKSVRTIWNGIADDVARRGAIIRFESSIKELVS